MIPDSRPYRRHRLLVLFALVLLLPALSRADGLGNSSATTVPSATQPAAEPWIAKPQAEWPQILLRNTITLKGFLPWTGTNGFLMRLPSGQVVAVTSPEGLVQGVNLHALKGKLAWSMHPALHPQNQLNLRELALPADKAESLEVVLMTVPQISDWPALVLTPNPAPLLPGQKLYMLGISDDDPKATHPIYEGIYGGLDHHNPAFFGYQYHAHIHPDSITGGPILDEAGHVVGVQETWYPEVTSGDIIEGGGLLISAALAAVKLPSAPIPTSIASAAVPTTRSAPNPEEEAQSALRGVEPYIAAQRYDIARDKLQKLINSYPGTTAAGNAQTQLNQIQDK
jgi:hypothetical protein